MTGERRGFALAVALAALVVLAALASLAHLSAGAATRESAALRDDVQEQAMRAILHARLASRVAGAERGDVIVHAVLLGGSDTTLTVIPLAWPWHRAVVSVAGVPLVAEAVRASMPTVPWCVPIVTGRASAVMAALLSAAPLSGCADSVLAVPPTQLALLDSAVVADVVLGAVPDTVIVSESDYVPRVRRARLFLDVQAGRTALGIVIAPLIHVGSVATVRGLVVAGDSVAADPGANVVAEPAMVRAAFMNQAALRPLGRRGLLPPP